MRPHALTAIVAAFVLTSCGGGGGGGSGPVSVTQPPPATTGFSLDYAGHYNVNGLPAPSISDIGHMPVYRDNRHIAVGIDQDRASLRNLPIVGSRGDTTIRYGTLNDGADESDIRNYENGDGTSGPLHRTGGVRWDESASPADQQRIIRAVQLINAALPLEREIAIGGSGATLIQFLDEAEFDRRFFSGWGYSLLVDRGGIWINRAYTSVNERRATILMAHEIAHAFNLDHTDEGTRGEPGATDSILLGSRDIYATRQGRPQPLSLLYVADRDAIRISDRWDDLGQWSSQSMHIAGQGPHTSFGVAMRNGYGEPWAHGIAPATPISANTALSGTVTWTGVLVGFTPDAQAVMGDAAVSMNLTGMTGRTDFTDLEYRTAGTTWGDGDLAYTIAFTGNTFRETGGDDGRLTGIFTGRSHDGVAGTLERSDLTAAFGGAR